MRKRLLSLIVISVLFLSSCSMGRSIDTSTEYEPEFVDGTYEIKSAHYDSFGFKKTFILGIHSGIITSVDYTETDRNGQKREDLASSLVPWEKCEYSFLQLKPMLYESSILSQGQKVDSISGATKTCEDYKILLNAAINSAKVGRPEEKVIDTFSDTYVITSEVDPITLSQEEMQVEIVDGKVSTVSVKELSTAPNHRIIGGIFTALADTSARTKSLADITDESVDTNVLTRYNAMLAQIRQMRGE